MTNLTVAADAVITAYNRVYKTDRHAVASALRAAAPLMEFVQDHRKLLAIADELEGITYGTYRCDLKPNDSTN